MNHVKIGTLKCELCKSENDDKMKSVFHDKGKIWFAWHRTHFFFPCHIRSKENYVNMQRYNIFEHMTMRLLFSEDICAIR